MAKVTYIEEMADGRPTRKPSQHLLMVAIGALAIFAVSLTALLLTVRTASEAPPSAIMTATPAASPTSPSSPIQDASPKPPTSSSFPADSRQTEVSDKQADAAAKLRLESIKVALTVVAGVGGLVALVVAYRRQQIAEVADAREHRVAEYNRQDSTARRNTDIYTRAVEQLGGAKAPVRLGAIYALENLAQENEDYRATVVDVLCAYLRMPFEPPPLEAEGGNPSDALERATALRSVKEDRGEDARGVDASSELPEESVGSEAHEELQVRLTAQKVLRNHLLATQSYIDRGIHWKGLNLDLSGAALVSFDMSHCSLRRADFYGARFYGKAWFVCCDFEGDAIFRRAEFREYTSFQEATFRKYADFNSAVFMNFADFQETKFLSEYSFNVAHFDSVIYLSSIRAKHGHDFMTFHLATAYTDASAVRRLPPGWRLEPLPERPGYALFEEKESANSDG
ncbi:pentapeptide repeat-containing protein [Micromonospora sp. NPDC050187]|uniref:pentapeptide repeat-containing protein n=1 Tax=Micromonospora sp. NPDC050187 TaxID=3364277 RepID=UPI00379B978D